MDYFRILNLEKEPFSNSPDPDFFYRSRQHLDCLQKIELSVRLRRGLNFVVGDVGAGKTTLCRQLIRNFASDDKIDTHLILDPDFGSPLEFLVTVAEIFNEEQPDKNAGERQIKEIIKQNIFRRGVDEKKIIVLIIDEGQKIPLPCLEILREFLNFETNQHKLLQIVIFAQREIEKRLENYKNFADRINLYHILKPMNFSGTKAMIEYRLEKSAEAAGRVFNPFSHSALWAIYRFTGGYPRKIVTLCHTSLLAMIIQNKTTAGLRLVRSCVKRSLPSLYRKRFPALAALLLVCLVSALFIYEFRPEILNPFISLNDQSIEASLQEPDFSFDAAETMESTKVPENIDPVNINDAERGPEAVIDTEQAVTPLNNPPGPKKQEEPKKQDQAVVNNHSPVENYTPMPLVPKPIMPKPIILGSVRLKENETLWRLLEKVYGLCTPQYLKAVLLINPEIKNQDHVEVGQKITLPATPVENKTFPPRAWFVKLEEKKFLADALEYLRLYPEDAPPAHLIPYWNKHAGLKYTIFLKDIFITEASALKRFRSLDPTAYPDGEVILLQNDDTVFFADPVWESGLQVRTGGPVN
ncbi:general secretion pathway protein A [Desulfosarcina sp. BuS5]|uniref:AAA family ATPase n=1 Tax=Desulfosarcina sp. BuS5 TaxID=933262 RepID=UPI000686B082|nr:AAA family ATPase [Desulfosarcina sp. BuS5]WDN87748.1 general secretion pathway protein A [Desulfosarcina sp. BuS5]